MERILGCQIRYLGRTEERTLFLPYRQQQVIHEQQTNCRLH